jgi:hypothetical protein
VSDLKSPFGSPGDRIEGKEKWFNYRGDDSMPTHYKADDKEADFQLSWKSARSMPAWAVRFHFEVASVKVDQRDGEWWWLAEITEVRP